MYKFLPLLLVTACTALPEKLPSQPAQVAQEIAGSEVQSISMLWLVPGVGAILYLILLYFRERK